MSNYVLNSKHGQSPDTEITNRATRSFPQCCSKPLSSLPCCWNCR